MTTAISKRTSAGIAIESSPGTAATVPTVYMPGKVTAKNMRKNEYVNDDRGTVDDNYLAVPSTRHCELTWKGDWHNDVCGYLFKLFFGTDTVTTPDATNAPTARKHVWGLTDVPPAATIFKSYDYVNYYSSYCAVEKLSIKWSAADKLVEFDSSLKGLWYVVNGGAYTPTYSSLKPFAGYMPSITLNGTATTDISEMSIEMDRKIELFYGSGGSPDFIKIDYNNRSAKVDFTARFDNTTLYNRFLNGTQDSIIVDIQGPQIGGTVFQELNFHIPIIQYDSIEQDMGKANILVKAKATALPGDSTYGLIQPFIVNTVTSYTT